MCQYKFKINIEICMCMCVHMPICIYACVWTHTSAMNTKRK